MKTIVIDAIGRDISAISLGLAEIGAGISEQDSFKLLDAYLDMGGNLLDTARVYSDWIPGEPGRSERVLGDWLTSRANRNQVILATKGGHPRLESMYMPRMSKSEVENDLNLSLKALRVDNIDLYYLHRDDKTKSVEEILSMLEDFTQAGKIRRYACSNWCADRMQEATDCALAHGWRGFAANQIFWNLGCENITGKLDDTLTVFNEPMRLALKRTGMLASAYSSQAGGFFSKLDRGDDVSHSIYNTKENRCIYQKVKSLGNQTGLTIAEIILLFILSQPIPSYAVVGCRTVDQLRETMSAGEKSLSLELVDELENCRLKKSV